MRKVRQAICLVVVCMMATANFASADTIQGINMDFVSIGNAGNLANTGGSGDNGRGSVGYNYRIGRYEITNAQWNAFTVAAGAPSGNLTEAYNTTATYTSDLQPINQVSWLEALQFCNYLTSGDKSKGAYLFSGDNANPGNFLGINRDAAKTTYGIIYVLPTEDEWYKAAYYKPDGSGYSLYANGLNTIPAADNGWNYSGGAYSIPWNVGAGTQEQNGTYDMMGNIYEWNETFTGGYSVYPMVNRCRGGSFYNDNSRFKSGIWAAANPYDEANIVGFRIASIPEPATVLLFGLGGMILRAKNGKRKA
jgi:formylglycine-generating enzyme